MDAEGDDFGLNGACPTSAGVMVVCGVIGALMGAMLLVVGFVWWALNEDFKEERWTRDAGPLGRPWG